MKTKNVCKFTSPHYSEGLSISCFVLETDREVIKKGCSLSAFRITLMLEGKCAVSVDAQKLSLSRGSILFGFKNESFTFTPDEQCKFMYIDFDGLRAEELLHRFNISAANRYFTGFEGVIPLWEEGVLRARETNLDLVAESVILYTFSRLNSEISQSNSVLKLVLDITEERFNNFDLSISAIAEELGYNAKYLSHLFKEKMNIGYSEYLRCLRVRYATSLFAGGLDSIKNVALLSGFSDPLYFSTVFKKVVGVSPKSYIHDISQKNRS